MTANSNITLATSAVVLDTGMWMGTDNASTAWLSGIAGVSAGDAEGGVSLLVVDFDCAGTTSTVFSLDDTAVLTAIPGVSGSKVIAVLGHTNAGAIPVAGFVISGATVTWTAAAADVHRLTILYS